MIDAIDEALDENGHSDLLTLIAGEFGNLPDWIGLMVTSRPEAPIIRQLRHYGVNEIRAGDDRNIGDIRAYAKRWLATLPIGEKEKVLDAVVTASEGNFL